MTMVVKPEQRLRQVLLLRRLDSCAEATIDDRHASLAELLDLAEADPEHALEEVRSFDASDPGWSEARRIESLALINSGRFELAGQILRQLLDGPLEVPQRGRSLMTLAVVEAYEHGPERADEVATEAIAHSSGFDRACAIAQRGAIRFAMFKYRDAEQDLRQGLATIERLEPDGTWAARVNMNLGLTLVQVGERTEALALLSRAAELYESLRRPRMGAQVCQNLGVLHAEFGDRSEALRMLQLGRQRLESLGEPLGDLLIDEGRVLLDVGLAEEAIPLLRRARAEFAGERRTLKVALALMLHAEAYEELGAFQKAQSYYESARELFDELAVVTLTAAAEIGRISNSDITHADRARRAESVYPELSTPGLDRYAAQAAVLSVENGGRSVETLSAVNNQTRAARPELRTRAWLALARRDLNAGDVGLANRRANAGMRAALEALDLQRSTGLSGVVQQHARSIAQIGLSTVRRPESVYRWMEYQRVAANWTPLPRMRKETPELMELRTLHMRASRDAPDAEMLERMSELELKVLVARLADDPLKNRRYAQPLRDTMSSLGNMTLVEFGSSVGATLTLVATSSSARILEPARTDAVHSQITHISAQMRRFAASPTPARWKQVCASVEDLAILIPVPCVQDGPVALVGPPALAAVPWTVLPQFETRAVFWIPTASIVSQRRPASGQAPSSLAVVSGPELVHSRPEADAVISTYGSSVVSRNASGRDLVEHIGNDVVHIAAHATARRNPFFSSVETDEGPVYIYDLLSPESTGRVAVLSACSSATMSSGGEHYVHGMASALFNAGFDSVIGTIAPLPDSQDTVDFVTAVHSGLAKGWSGAAALAQARKVLPSPIGHLFVAVGS